MSTSHTELEFSIYQNLVLRKIYFFGISYKSVYLQRRLSFLRYYSLLEHDPRNSNRYVLSEKAKMYLRYKRRSNFRFWIPVIISFFALLSSYDVYTNSLLEKVLQVSMKTLKTILENLDAFLQTVF